MTTDVPHVIVIGAGFAGLRAVRALRTAPVRVTLIDRHNYQTFQPFLYQVATAGLNVADVVFPIRGAIGGTRTAASAMPWSRQSTTIAASSTSRTAKDFPSTT